VAEKKRREEMLARERAIVEENLQVRHTAFIIGTGVRTDVSHIDLDGRRCWRESGPSWRRTCRCGTPPLLSIPVCTPLPQNCIIL
jgi:hypothetical protein